MNLINKKKLLIPIFFFSFSCSIEVSASSLGIYVFEDYQNIYNLLKEKEKESSKASLILSNAKLYSIDYSPSPFTRTNRPNPSYPIRQSKDGIEGYVEVTFEINDDGSTSGHFVSDSNPNEYFDEVSLESAKNLRYAFNQPTDERTHSYRFIYRLNERSTKVPNGYYTCLDLIKQARFSEAKDCAQKRKTFSDEVVADAYKVIVAEANYYLGNKQEAINSLFRIIKDESQNSFYLKTLAISNLTTFLFYEERFSEIISLEDILNQIRKVGYKEQLINSHYYLGVSHFYLGNNIEALFYLKLSLQDTNCRQTLRLEPGESFIDWKKNSLYRLYPDNICYSDFYARIIKTLEAINNVI